MTRRKSCREDQCIRHFNSNNSDDSFSSESDVEKDDSDVSSDDLDLGLSGTSEAQQKFKRLRRIFLNRPTKAKVKEINQRRRHNVSDRDTSEVDRRPAKDNASKRRHSMEDRDSDSSSSSSSCDTKAVNRLNKPVTGISPTRPLQAAIEQHTNALWEQMKRHSAQRDSTANQVQSMLEQAIDELQFLKQQEERAMESQVRLIRESYALRLEVLQQRYLNTVAEIEDEMYTSIQKRQEECDANVLAAAKKLQDQTQRAVLKDLAVMNNEPIKEQHDSSSFSTSSSSASHSKVHRNGRTLRHDPLSSPEQASHAAPIVKQVSPVSQQRAKLHALEEKLAFFSPESLHRVKHELAAPIRHSKVERSCVKPKWTQTTPSIDQNHSPNKPDIGDCDEWRSSPLSPLREGPSYWKNGISLEARDREDSSNADGSSKSEHADELSASKTRRKIPASLISRRFLRPEEEEELRHLRTSIGLAKDWMAKNNHT